MPTLIRHMPWLMLAIIGAFALGTVALHRGETINALWIVIAAASVHLIAYRYYALFIARRVMALDPKRMTPAMRHNDGLDYVPTNKYVLFGHHFAAIAGAGPLVGPVLAPRDYLSTFLKIGTIAGLALGIVIVAPELKMPALTQFVDGTGPVWSGNLFPFLFITIACGAVSGFHALISSGTTPKLLENESHMPFIGYGGMLMESFVAIMALVAACVIDPGIYFVMNSPASVIGTTAESAARVVSQWGFVITPEMITQTAHSLGEHSIISRTGGAPTLAVGMAHILSEVFGADGMKAFWYHFAILFEALFILTAVDAGTRAGRFILQDLLGTFAPAFGKTSSWTGNLTATGLCVAAWGYFLYQGVVDPLGGINTLWPLFGIANQMLAGIALILATVVLFKMKRERYAWVTALPAVWLLICTLTAGVLKIFSDNPAIGFLAHAARYQAALASGDVLAPAKSMAQMRQVVFNDFINATLAGVFIVLVISLLVFGVHSCWLAWRTSHSTARELPLRGVPTETRA